MSAWRLARSAVQRAATAVVHCKEWRAWLHQQAWPRATNRSWWSGRSRLPGLDAIHGSRWGSGMAFILNSARPLAPNWATVPAARTGRRLLSGRRRAAGPVGAQAATASGGSSSAAGPTSGSAATRSTTAPPPPPPPPPPDVDHTHISSYVKALELALERRGYNLVRITSLWLSVFAVGVVLYWNRFLEWGSEQGAGVASRTLEDELVKLKAHQLAAELVQQLIHDERTFQEFLTLLLNVLNSEQSVTTVRSQLHRITSSLLADERLREQFTEMLASAITSESVKRSALQLTNFVLENEHVRQRARELSTNVLENADVQREAGALAWAAFKSGFLGLHPRKLENVKVEQAVPSE
ncbi:hypothetical protein CDCA_CDCA01G0233 [Cyanidium caldarium]|uniref:Uncharacterized protein n=1 Tax=Cyanidium caldarium TaxID=2771 RepID=A0AAV9IPN9_CYACA|nr:hypothetical protein CDCA_CDCA01G0233 [Cyanidium caldarium]